ncbi:mitochondrial rho gtpase 1 [Curvularia clavata]|uniref:Mitochondrial Rho GTPase 1 n=1 Tax=Curvularia clavata TaxID=95742 RepID=A0A9Q8ZEU1_CURCL|nr:mitochondrial rho gtpase 1 [Curvularia clavata]
MATVRICLCGDDGVGKSSIITSLVKDVFVTAKIQPVLPQVTLPPTLGTPDNVTTTIVDTSALPHERHALRMELRKSNVILLVYSDHYSYERVALFWMPYFRSLGVNVPVVLCANKSDLASNGTTSQVVAEEMLPIMNEFKEIDSCIRVSAKEHHNINEVFFLCQKAVTHPIAPLYDSKENMLKPAAVSALRRIFHLCDTDKDGYWNDQEIHDFQIKCFEKPLGDDDLANIKRSMERFAPGATDEYGMDEKGFLLLNKIFAEKGRHETIWIILRKFHYTDSLSLQDTFLHPKFEVPQFSSAELSPSGYRFFVDLFLKFDMDNDGGLNDRELVNLFAPTPGMPTSWVDSAFPSCTVRNEAGYITLQGWLAQWSMTTFEEPKTTLAYLAYLGFESGERGGTTSALKVTKARKRRKKPGRVERNVFLCYVLGSSGSGKSSLLSAFLQRPFSQTYHPTIKPRSAVNSVELKGGKQCYLILEELGELEPAILENQAKLDACDLLCYTYDSSDPTSFAHVVELRKKYPHLDELPSVYTALKADQDKTMQRCEQQPDEYTSALRMAPPLHVSAKWNSISELFVHLAESATHPSTAFPKQEEDEYDYLNLSAVLITPRQRTPARQSSDLCPPHSSRYGIIRSDVAAAPAAAPAFPAKVRAAHPKPKLTTSCTPQATNRAQELDRLYQMRNPPRRGHAPQISISDDNHHVTEAIGDLYGGDSDTESNRRSLRPLSFVPSPNGDSIQSFGAFEAFDPFPNSPPARSPLRPPMSFDHPATPTSPQDGSDARQNKSPTTRSPPNNGQMSPPLSRSNSGTASHQFPLNDLDYESSPAGLAQELSNLQAIRRMSMGVNSADPDLPSFQSANTPPSPPPTSEDDESKLFWVPARLHPELAPMEFKTFIEDKIDKTRRRSGDADSLNPDNALGRQGSGAGLRRKKSMLSRQIDTGIGYKDGAERLERKRSGAKAPGGLANLQELENIQEDPVSMIRRLSIDHKNAGESEMGEDGDLPIVPGSKLGGMGALKRSTRTTYRRGSLRKGGPALSRRLVSHRQGEGDAEESPSTSPVHSNENISEVPPLPISRVQSEPVHSAFEGSHSNFSRPQQNRSPPSTAERPGSAEGAPGSSSPEPQSSPQPRRFHSRIASNGRTTAPLPGYVPSTQQQVPQIVETPPPQDQRPFQPPERSSSRQIPPPSQQQPAGPRSYPQPQQPPSNQQRQSPSARPNRHAQAAQASPIKPSQSLDDLVGHSSPMPGTSNRVDSLSIIPNAPEEKKLEKKSKDRKDSSEGGVRKTSWGWFGGDKEKEKDKGEKEKDKDTPKKTKNKLSKPQEKGHDDTRLDLLQTSIQGSGRGRESVVLDRESVKLEEERKKESAKKNSGDGKKEKEPGLLSSIFGGGKKKGEKESSHKKNASRGLSPDPPVRILKPDIDYNWTRFSILEERAIYRMAHIKLANPRRELYSQVLLSNFMYSYLAKVQQMHPQISIGNSKQAKQAQQAQQAQQAAQQKKEQEQQMLLQQQQQQQAAQQQVVQQQQQQQQAPQQAQPEEFAQYQRYQQQQQQQQYEQQQKTQEWPSVFQQQENGFSPQPQQNGNQRGAVQNASYNQNPRDSHHSSYGANGTNGGSGGYSVANAQNYLGHPGKGSYEHYAETGQAKAADDDMW